MTAKIAKNSVSPAASPAMERLLVRSNELQKTLETSQKELGENRPRISALQQALEWCTAASSPADFLRLANRLSSRLESLKKREHGLALRPIQKELNALRNFMDTLSGEGIKNALNDEWFLKHGYWFDHCQYSFWPIALERAEELSDTLSVKMVPDETGKVNAFSVYFPR